MEMQQIDRQHPCLPSILLKKQVPLDIERHDFHVEYREIRVKRRLRSTLQLFRPEQREELIMARNSHRLCPEILL
jgi:hypothetical protein